MTGGRGGAPSYPAPVAGPKFNLWAYHSNVRRWLLIVPGLTGQAAVKELTVRQDIVRRRNEPCRMVVLEDGKFPEGVQ